MKKSFIKSVLSLVLVVFMIGIYSIPALATGPDEDARRYRGDLLVFLAFDGDIRENGDHGMQYFGPGYSDNNPEISAQTDIIRAGYTTTVSLQFPVAVSHVHMLAPVVVASDDAPLSMLDAKVSLTVDGMTLFEDFSAGEILSPRPIGDYQNSFILSGGLEESGETFIDTAVLTGASKIEYTVTVSSVYEPAADENPESSGSGEDAGDGAVDPSGEDMGADAVMSGDGTGDPEEAFSPDQTGNENVPAGGGTAEAGDDKTIDTKGLACGILVAVIAVIMIVAGALLSRTPDSFSEKEVSAEKHSKEKYPKVSDDFDDDDSDDDMDDILDGVSDDELEDDADSEEESEEADYDSDLEEESVDEEEDVIEVFDNKYNSEE